ncbi:hypothetical protein VSR01_10630 [Actinacidiphila sp. DG2A-62]|uniref:hypothetical protein n=1 Tax=Actinacidiphila sp. DG2A-62 TaxID=3108821 RepID=UPI002DBA1390|nr:hypothetical protein [Actinacidiphila sp. DG2A-62]MEC3993973.1 hypothetical protein [Actinacidiphila sp. DG2A-62]
MTREEQAAVLAEELPTGLFGGGRPTPAYPPVPADPRAAEHRADLLAALDAHDADLRRAHLRLVVDAEQAVS